MRPKRRVAVRHARPGDLDALVALEHRVFSYDRLSRRSARKFISSDNAAVLVAGPADALAGYALVLFRPAAMVARLYSIAVATAAKGQGIGTALLAAAEAAAKRRGCRAMRLEAQAKNARAIRRYRKAGYEMIGRRERYYDDGGDALRFEKALYPQDRT